ncbi:Hsp70 protein-domain-containing protein [Pseudoneurospora amorphoporcata]|uniref:Hsp70 protein-domain-containing protein n=1 Tax=Pseudoneurospora amorphoporcata TaxID=241081 RepID=A0AAN6NTR4_9PEZI|nr:Hsp70 protein-domain-containing protein [Pseudoneurospora amorphoporcata]
MARVSTLSSSSPLRIFLSAIFLFSAHVFAVSAVLGVDLGTEYIKATLVKPGIPLEIVLTKDSRRKETSAVAFKPSSNRPQKGAYPERVYGSDAMAIAPRFPGDVYPNLKAILGLPAGSAQVREYAERHPALRLEAHKTKGTAAFKSAAAFTEEEEAWLVEELLAMELQSIRANAELLAGTSSSVRSVVITVPPFYTVEEKRALELSAELAGLKVLSLISDGLAVGLNYATSRQFPNVNKGEKAENHIIFDMGAGSTKATVLQMQSRTVKDVGKFNKTIQEVTVLGSGWDRTLGGDALNYLIVDDMIRQFVESPKAQKAGVTLEAVKSHGRTIAKLTKEAERLRHVLSANQNTQASFEGLYDDVDFKYKITRAEFEDMAATHAQRVSVAVNNALTMAGLQIKDLDSVILHGGASRTPFVQKELENVLGGADKIRTNVNSDEAAVFGAGFRAAALSPSFRVKEIKIADGASYPAGMRWNNDEGKPKHQRLWTATSHLGAPAKEVTFNNVQDLSVNFYQLVMDGVEVDTKVFTTKNLTASIEELVEKHKCEKADIKFKVGVRLLTENGEVDVTKAAVECETDEPEKAGIVDGVKNLFGFGKKDKTEGEEDSASASTESSTSTSSTTETSSSASASASAEPKKKQLVQINVDFTLTPTGPASLLPKASIQSLKDRLKSFAASDRTRQLREEALNQLEAYTYKISDILDRESFIAHSTAAERETLQQKKDDASDWLYGDGADATREDFKAKLKELQNIVDPVLKRAEEAEKRPEILKGLQDALDNTKTFVKDIREKIAAYDAFHASASASASASSSIASSSSSSATAPASSVTGDFDDLEDEDPMKVLEKDLGPVPPLYSLEDLKESEDLYTSISTWLELKVAEQEKLGPTDDPVLTVKDLLERREKLDKAGMALAMKGVKNFEKTQAKAKASGSKASGGKKNGKATKAGGEKPAKETTVSDEEMEEMLRKVMADEKAKEEAKAQKESKEEPIKHEEL